MTEKMSKSNNNIRQIPSREIAWAMSHDEWLKSAWNEACAGITNAPTRVISCENGVWKVACDTLADAAHLLNHPKVIARIGQLGMVRPLPMIRSIRPVLPKTMTSPGFMFTQIPIREMPDKYWHELVWRMSVDETTAETTTIVAIQNGVWRIRCDSQHAWKELQNPAPIMKKVAFLAQVRPVQDLKRLELLLGNM
ncbi:MAG: hypothetical protein J6A01_01480 [Proteobacteria bacterium]|nr:hypothetical protein [Pseudomonadota bacterium]